MIGRLFLSVGAAALLGAGSAMAAETADLEGVVVTATRASGGVEPDRTGSSVTLIDAQAMRDRQVRMVSDVLRDVPGFAVSRSGSPGSPTQVRVRGAEANHVLTLVDGIEAADPFQGEFDYSTLLADDVARIEIIRGPQSALYGSEAVAGVVNYITPTAKEQPGGSLRVEFGSQGTLGGAARYGLAQGPLDLVAGMSVQRTDGYVGQTLPGGSRRLGSELQAYSLRGAYEASQALTLLGVLRYSDLSAGADDSEFGRGLVDTVGGGTKARSLLYAAGADLTLMDGAWTHGLTYQGVDAKRSGYGAFGRSSGDDGRRDKVSYVTTYRLETGGLTHVLTGAFDWEKETYRNTSPPSAGADGTKRSIVNKGLVGEYDLRIGDRAGIGGAVRHDDNDAFADATTWKVQGYYRLSGAVRVRAAAGTGIKNPSQTELFGYNATGPFPFAGNPFLKTERSKSWEAGADLSALDGRISLGATYFEARLEDEIFGASAATAAALNRSGCPVPPPGFSTTCNRASESKQAGIELSGEARLTDALTVSGAYTHLKARENGLEEIRRAPNIASANVTWKPLEGRASVNLNVRYNGRQLDSNFFGIVPPLPAGLPRVKAASGVNVSLPAYTLVNLSGSYALADGFEVYARIENLTDADYYEVFGYPQQGRTVTAGARVRF